MSATSQWQLRRLASRALRVLERKMGVEPGIDSFGESLGVSAAAFIAAYDKARGYSPVWSEELREGRTAAGRLLRKLRGWTAQLQVDVPSFNGSQIGDTIVLDDLVNDVNVLFETVDSANTRGQQLHYADALKADLETALEPARAELKESGDAHLIYTQLLREAREAADLFQRHLIAFRRTLAAFHGRSDPDYQKLRVARARITDTDDDDTAAALPDGIPPADDVTESGENDDTEPGEAVTAA